MYVQATIDILIDRVGWVTPVDSTFPYVLEARNTESTSGRDFQFYNGYITGKNIIEILPNKNETELEFNQYLYDLRVQSVLESLYLVIDKDPNYNPLFDHDTYISERLGLFDEVIGLVHAIKVLSLLSNSIRSNRIERLKSMDIVDLQKRLDDAIAVATPPFDKIITVIGTKIW